MINGGNCLGIRSRPGRYDTLFIPRWKLPAGSRPAPVALITGSGAFAITRLARMAPLDPRYVITIGNQMDLTAGDFLAHLADDPEVRVFGVYLEGFTRLDGLRFLEAAARITASGRQVILYRAGRTAAGASASASHTAAIAGDAVVTRELARAAGVTIADTPADFDDLVRTFTLLDGRPARGRRLGAASNAGSECVTIADHAGSLELVRFAAATDARLLAILEPTGIVSVVDLHNPLDLTPIANAAITAAVARVILEADETDVGIVGVVPMTDTLETLEPGPGHDEDLDRPGAIASTLADLWRETTKPWVCVVDAGSLYGPFVDRLGAAGIPVLAHGRRRHASARRVVRGDGAEAQLRERLQEPARRRSSSSSAPPRPAGPPRGSHPGPPGPAPAARSASRGGRPRRPSRRPRGGAGPADRPPPARRRSPRARSGGPRSADTRPRRPRRRPSRTPRGRSTARRTRPRGRAGGRGAGAPAAR